MSAHPAGGPADAPPSRPADAPVTGPPHTPVSGPADAAAIGRPAARVAGWSALAAAVLATAWAFAPPMGTDLAAQVARANFAADHGWRPIDLGWYGGVNQFGYSLFAGPLLGALGVRPVGAVSAVVSAAAFGYLLWRCGAPRALLGGVLGAVVAVGNLVSGRTTFALGLALGMVAVAIVAAPWPAHRAARMALAGVLAAVATAASPVAGLFVGLAGGTLVVAELGSRAAADPARRRWPEGVALAAGAAVAVAPMAALLGDGGEQPFTQEAVKLTVGTVTILALAVPWRTIRVGAGLATGLLLVAYYVPSAVGSNAMRVPMLYALPLVAAFAPLSARWLAALLVAMVWWQNPVVAGDIGRAGAAETRAGFHRPLLDELARRGPIGRVEVVPLRDHWESAYVAREIPLARGWQRQADTDRDPLFYRDVLGVDEYQRWLRDNAVSYVAVAPGRPLDRYGRQEAALVASGVPALTEVWRGGDWVLYAVAGAAPLVAPPATLVSSGPGAVVFDAPAAGDLLLRVRWSRWLRASAGCLAPAPGGWTLVRVPAAGRFTVSSGLSGSDGCGA